MLKDTHNGYGILGLGFKVQKNIPQKKTSSIGRGQEQDCGTVPFKLRRPRMNGMLAPGRSTIWIERDCFHVSLDARCSGLAVSMVGWLCLLMHIHQIEKVTIRRQYAAVNALPNKCGLMSGPHDCFPADPQRRCIREESTCV